jgi:hypothetical protein
VDVVGFKWGSNRFALICAHFTSITSLCGPLIGPGHLFDIFPTICNYFNIVLVCFGFVIGESISSSF